MQQCEPIHNGVLSALLCGDSKRALNVKNIWGISNKNHGSEKLQSTQIFGTGNGACYYPDTHKTEMSATAFRGRVAGPVLTAAASLCQQQMK